MRGKIMEKVTTDRPNSEITSSKSAVPHLRVGIVSADIFLSEEKEKPFSKPCSMFCANLGTHCQNTFATFFDDSGVRFWIDKKSGGQY